MKFIIENLTKEEESKLDSHPDIEYYPDDLMSRDIYVTNRETAKLILKIIETFVGAIEETQLADNGASILNDFHVPRGWCSDEAFYRVTSEKYTNM